MVVSPLPLGRLNSIRSTDTSPPGSQGATPPPGSVDTLTSADLPVVHFNAERFEALVALFQRNKSLDLPFPSFGLHPDLHPALQPGDSSSPSGSGASSEPGQLSPGKAQPPIPGQEAPSQEERERALAALRPLTFGAMKEHPSDIVLIADKKTPVEEVMDRVRAYDDREEGARLFIAALEVGGPDDSAYNDALRAAVAKHNEAHPEFEATVLDAGALPPPRADAVGAIAVVPTAETPVATPAVLVKATLARYHAKPREADAELANLLKKEGRVDRKMRQPIDLAITRARQMYNAAQKLRGDGLIEDADRMEAEARAMDSAARAAPLPFMTPRIGRSEAFRLKYVEPSRDRAPVSCWTHFENFWKAFAKFFEDLWQRIVDCFTYKNSV